jgi:hypothetical protein
MCEDKKMMYSLLLICFSTFVLTACTVNVNVNTPGAAKDEATEAEVTQEDIEELIIGKWMTSERDGQPALTDEKNVYDIVSTIETYVSLSRSKGKSPWNNGVKRSVDIKGNVVTIAPFPGDNSSVVNEFTITDISDNEFTANIKNTRTVEGSEPVVTERIDTYVRVNEDFSEDIIGTWEGRCTSEKSVFDDGQDHRWTFNDDGTLVYYEKDGDSWVPGEYPSGEYFVAGNLLCSRWIEDDEEYREWWEISIDGDKMNWTALREDEDGNTFTATFEMTKIESNKTDLSEQIIGKWIVADRNGNPSITNRKLVITFVSDSKAYVSGSFIPLSQEFNLWLDNKEVDVAISGSKLTLTGNPETNGTVTNELTIKDFKTDEFTANDKLNITLDDNKVLSKEDTIRFIKVNNDYSEDIIGTWEGHCTSEKSVFDDGEEHRWEYKADGTYIYYVKDGDDWIPSTNTLNEYFVAGNLLCTRWINDDEESREWWEISIDGDKMNWAALREDEDGNTFTAEFEMTKVKE